MKKNIKAEDLTPDQRGLLLAANHVMRNAQSEYSGFAVGAALLVEDEDGKQETVLGVNVENVSFSVTTCAERVAIGNMATKGYKKILMVAVIAKPADGLKKEIVSPCGMCRQAIIKYGENIEVIMANTDMSKIEIWTSSELLPLSFSDDSFKK